MPQQKDITIEQFLSVALGAKEVSLVIVKDESGVQECIQTLDGSGYERAIHAHDLMRQGKKYILLDHEPNKHIYDFSIQYSTGQIELFDTTHMKPVVYIPQYATDAVVLIISQADIRVWQEHSFDILSVAGATYQL